MASSGCCTGSEIDLKSMKTPGQNQMGEMLGPLLAQGMRQGATPFTGQLSAGPDQAQMAAMQAMMGIGGQGQYQQQGYPTMGAPGQPGPNVPEWDYNYVSPGEKDDDDTSTWRPDDTKTHEENKKDFEEWWKKKSGRDLFNQHETARQRQQDHGWAGLYEQTFNKPPFSNPSARTTFNNAGGGTSGWKALYNTTFNKNDPYASTP